MLELRARSDWYQRSADTISNTSYAPFRHLGYTMRILRYYIREDMEKYSKTPELSMTSRIVKAPNKRAL